MRYLIGICAFVCAVLCPHFSYAVSEHKALVIHGDSYPSSCDSDQREILYHELARSEVPDLAQAWRAIELLLCSCNNASSSGRVISLLQKKIRETTESTGYKPVIRSVPRNEILIDRLMMAGSAWNSSILVQGARIILQFGANEACVNSVTLVYDKHKWSVSEIGQACD